MWGPKYEIAPCPKCNGRGVLPGYHHIARGVCFRCGGTGYDADAYEEIVGRKLSEFADAKAAKAALAEIGDAEIADNVAAANAEIADFKGDFVEQLFAFKDALDRILAAKAKQA